MDVEKMIEQATRVIDNPLILWYFNARDILAVRDHYEALLAAERSKVVQEVREYVRAEQYELFDEVNSPNLDVNEFNKWLDSMEPGKEAKE